MTLRVQTINVTDHAANAVFKSLSAHRKLSAGIQTFIQASYSYSFWCYWRMWIFLCCDDFTTVSGFFPPLLHLLLTSTFANNMAHLFVPGYMNCWWREIESMNVEWRVNGTYIFTKFVNQFNLMEAHTNTYLLVQLDVPVNLYLLLQ